MARLKNPKPVHGLCPNCKGYKWEDHEVDEGRMVFRCRICGYLMEIVYSET